MERAKAPGVRDSRRSTGSELTKILRTAHVIRPSCFVTESSKVLFPLVQIRHDSHNCTTILQWKHGFLQLRRQRKVYLSKIQLNLPRFCLFVFFL